jgi:hypothetical protein
MRVASGRGTARRPSLASSVRIVNTWIIIDRRMRGARKSLGGSTGVHKTGERTLAVAGRWERPLPSNPTPWKICRLHVYSTHAPPSPATSSPAAGVRWLLQQQRRDDAERTNGVDAHRRERSARRVGCAFVLNHGCFDASGFAVRIAGDQVSIDHDEVGRRRSSRTARPR